LGETPACRHRGKPEPPGAGKTRATGDPGDRNTGQVAGPGTSSGAKDAEKSAGRCCELDITVQENTLLVTGKAQKEDENGGGYLHRGIARRTFERRFSLADHMKVTGASLDNGLLYVEVVREVPETAKPRTIKIGTTVETVQPQVTEQKAA
jgi:molecular chaperone IbpA